VKRALATLPDVPPGTRSALAGKNPPPEHRSPFSEVASREFSKESGTRGLVELYQVARFLIRVLKALLVRYRAHRDHGLYATCVEELIRGFKLAGSGLNEWGKALQWNRMKQDTADAFGPDPNVHAGTALLSRLQAAIATGLELRRITLVGHSTGAIYIANWLEASRSFLPESLKQDIVYLAPAITHDRFAEMLRNCAPRIGKFRNFAMNDTLERDDQLLQSESQLTQDWRRFIYPSSLLYLVSGILESRLEGKDWIDEADMPLVGMERYLTQSNTYPDERFPSVKAARDWLNAAPGRLIWSKTTVADLGFQCEAIDHGGFTHDPLTRDSLRHIVS
jgi:hypothetical protein